ncbi:MAG: DnaJ domain-containing protein [Elusimicrobiota bacterium]|nr:DnaJ domain-containing protein [Elusimicrobiota bacterium]
MGDPYEDLGLPYGADPQAVKDAFSRLARRLSPERRAADPEAAAAYAKIEAAYAELSKRKALVDPFEQWGKGGPDLQGPPPRVSAGAPEAAGPAAEQRPEQPELKPGEEFNFRRFKGRLCVVVGVLMVARGASVVYIGPSGWVNRLARHLPWVGELEREPAFIVMFIGMAALIWGAGSFMISDREAEELERRGRLQRLRRRARRPF